MENLGIKRHKNIKTKILKQVKMFVQTLKIEESENSSRSEEENILYQISDSDTWSLKSLDSSTLGRNYEKATNMLDELMNDEH